MPRVIGIDPGTVSIDVCGLDDGRVFLDRSWSTTEPLAEPPRFAAELEAAGPLDLIAGPSGSGRPLTRARETPAEDLRLCSRAAPGQAGAGMVEGVGGWGGGGRLGFRASGALVGKGAYPAGAVRKALLFRGGAGAVGGWEEQPASPGRFPTPATPQEQVAWDAF